MGAIAGAVTVYGVVMALAPALQVRRMLRERSAAGVSLAYAVVLWAGFALWLAYGIDAGDLPLILANTVALGATGTMILVTCRVRRAELRLDPSWERGCGAGERRVRRDSGRTRRVTPRDDPNPGWRERSRASAPREPTD